MAERRGPDRRFFDLWSLVYDAPLAQRLTYRPVHDAVLRSLARLAPRNVLDVGCGTGRLATRIGRELRGARVVGVDFSRGMLLRAQQRDARGRWVRGNALRLPFANASFDALVSTEAFHWFPSQPAALAEFFRVLVPEGRALIALIHPASEYLSRATRAGSRLAGQPLYWPTRRRMRAQSGAVPTESVPIRSRAMVKKISHIGIVVRDLAAAEKLWTESFGLKVFNRMEIAVEGIRSVFLSPNGTPDEMYIELMEPTDKENLDNAVARRLARKGEGFYHVALQVDDVASAGKGLAERGLEVIERAPVAAGQDLRWVVHPRSSTGVLVELI